jgi:cation transport regulator ChaC
MIGILAYGSLITHPGQEIESVLDHVIPDVQTPFPVEYARCSRSRAGAPTLVPVPTGCGAPVRAVIFVLKKYTRKQKAQNFLYRREIHQEGDLKVIYEDQAQRQKRDALVIESIKNQYGLSIVYHTMLNVNFLEILDPNLTEQAKATLLAQAAIDSITHETFDKGLDGIQYLVDNIDAGVRTALTESYCQVLLDKARDAHDLRQARKIIAQKKGIAL